MTNYYYIFSNNSNCPKGWTKDTTYVNKGILFSDSTLSTGGAYTHSHTITTSSGPSFSGSDIATTPTSLYTANPYYITKVFCKIDTTKYTPVNKFILCDTTCPSGYLQELNNYYLAVGNSNSKNNSSGHTHSISGSQLDSTSSSGTHLAKAVTTSAVTGNTTASIPYVTLRMCIKN